MSKQYGRTPQLMMPWHPGRTISTSRAAEILGCSSNTVLRMIEDGTLEAFKQRKNRPRSHFLVIYESVLRLRDEQRQDAGVELAPRTPSTPAAPVVLPRRS